MPINAPHTRETSPSRPHWTHSCTSLTYKDNGLTKGVQYGYQVTAWNDCNTNGVFDAGTDTERLPSIQACGTSQ